MVNEPNCEKISALIFKLYIGPASILKMIKGQNYLNNVGGVKVICIIYYDAFNYTKFHVKAFKSYKVDIISTFNAIMGYNSFKNVDGVTVLIVCVSSDSDFYLYLVL